jgi:hypothetical protein
LEQRCREDFSDVHAGFGAEDLSGHAEITLTPSGTRG